LKRRSFNLSFFGTIENDYILLSAIKLQLKWNKNLIRTKNSVIHLKERIKVIFQDSKEIYGSYRIQKMLERENLNYCRSYIALLTKETETKQLGINENEFVELLNSVGIEKYPKLTYAGIGEPQIIENSKTKAFGSYSSAIFYDGENNKIEHIWFSTYDWKNIQKTKNADGLNAIGEKYDMIMVDFTSEEVIDLKKKSEIEKYLKAE